MTRIRAALWLATSISISLAASCSDEGTGGGPEPIACGYHDECPASAVCFQGKCEGSVTCLERANCRNVPVCADFRCICSADHRCLPVCITDTDCPADGQCVNGVCERYTAKLGDKVPASGARGALQVGVARVELDAPVGVSMAGYSSRSGPRTPYRDALGGSNGWFGKPDVRAIAFDDGAETFVLLRIPTCWSTDYMLARTAEKVEAKIGLNLVDRIITSASHSHSHPARYWHLVVGLNFGYFGYDEFSWEIFERLTDSFAEAVIAAIEAKKPAKLGWSLVDDFDPGKRIHRDRRERNNGIPDLLQRDDRMMVMRIDDAGGQPVAILTNFGMHGTVFGNRNPLLTGDAPGGVEAEITRLAELKYGRSVLGVFLQGNAGDISPGGDDLGHDDEERVQLIGRRVFEIIEPVLERMETRADVPVSIVSGRVPLSHDVLYGAGPTYYDKTNVCEDSPSYYRFGAFQCTEGYLEDEDPTTKFKDGELGCVLSVECLTAGYGVPQFQKTRLSVARLGGLVLATLPGEPTSQTGRRLAQRVKEATGAEGATVLGYSQDHHFYLLPEEDWLQGGYEAARGIWGWKLADYLAEKSVELSKEIMKPAAERRWDNMNLKPMYWNIPEAERTRVPPTESAAPETVILDVPATVRRLDVVDFRWQGGHPGVDRPRIVLESRAQGADFAPVRRPGGAPYDDSMLSMLVQYEGSCTRENCREHAWRVTWEEGRSFPRGSYRFRVEGNAYKGGAAVPYVATSRAFELVPTDQLPVYGLAATAAGGIEARVVEPPAVVYEPEGAGMARRARRVGHRLRSALVPANIGGPLEEGAMVTVTGTVTPSGGQPAQIQATVGSVVVSEPRRRITGYDEDGRPETADAGVRPTSKLEIVPAPPLAAGASFVQLRVEDAFGNSGTATATITR